MASFDAVWQFLMRGNAFDGVYGALDWAVLSPSRSIIGAVGGIGAGIGAAIRAVKQWVFGTADGLPPTEATSAEEVGSPCGGLNQISEMGLNNAVSAQSLGASSYHSAEDGDSQIYLLAPSVGNSQEDVAVGETAV